MLIYCAEKVQRILLKGNVYVDIRIFTALHIYKCISNIHMYLCINTCRRIHCLSMRLLVIRSLISVENCTSITYKCAQKQCTVIYGKNMYVFQYILKLYYRYYIYSLQYFLLPINL